MAIPILGAAAVADGLLTPAQLRHRYEPIFRGIYFEKEYSPTLFERIAAARLAVPRAVIAGIAASALHGAKWVDDDEVIELVGRCRPQRGLKGREETLRADEVMIRYDVPVTTPARTAFDLARRLGKKVAIGRLDALMSAAPFSIEDALLLAKVHPRARRLADARKVLPFVDGGAESLRESRLRMVLIDGGLPVPTTQFTVYRADGKYIRRIDMVWEDYRVGAEYDGEQHLTSREQYARDVWSRGELQKLGWFVIHVIKEHHDANIVAEARAALLARGWDGHP